MSEILVFALSTFVSFVVFFPLLLWVGSRIIRKNLEKQ